MNTNISEKADVLVFGSDPEVFSGYKKDGKLYVLPAGVFRILGIEHTPDIKHPVFYTDKEEGIIIMEDGVAFEATLRPSTSWKELYERIVRMKNILRDKILSQFPQECDGNVHSVPTINYEVPRWKEGEHKELEQCFIFGCDADYNAFEGGSKGQVVDALSHPFRYAGGHIHISGVPGFKEDTLFAVQCLAAGVGLAAVAFSKQPELDKERTFLYGKPGKFRPQMYSKRFNEIPNTDFGIEYRTPSVEWTNSEEQAEQVFRWAEISVRNLFEQGLGADVLAKYSKDIQETILSCNQENARGILSYIESRV